MNTALALAMFDTPRPSSRDFTQSIKQVGKDRMRIYAFAWQQNCKVVQCIIKLLPSAHQFIAVSRP